MVEALGLTDEESDEYLDAGSDDGVQHRLLGHPGAWATPEAEAARAKYDEIRKEDLKNRHFDQVWLMMQCG